MEGRACGEVEGWLHLCVLFLTSKCLAYDTRSAGNTGAAREIPWSVELCDSGMRKCGAGQSNMLHGRGWETRRGWHGRAVR